MSRADVIALFERVERDVGFAIAMESVGCDPEALLAKLVTRAHTAGFDAEPEEIRAAFTERYRVFTERDGAELTEEQLERTAGGAGGIPPGALTPVVQPLAPLGGRLVAD